jgi:hypothetical protein
MSSYDYDVIRTGNPDHPYNRPPMEEEMFESDNLSECLDYCKLANDYEPLEAAILNQETVIEKAVSELQFCVDAMAHSDNTLVPNRLRRVIHLIIKNQIKRYE